MILKFVPMTFFMQVIMTINYLMCKFLYDLRTVIKQSSQNGH
jgi:hypothetical protein